MYKGDGAVYNQDTKRGPPRLCAHSAHGGVQGKQVGRLGQRGEGARFQICASAPGNTKERSSRFMCCDASARRRGRVRGSGFIVGAAVVKTKLSSLLSKQLYSVRFVL